MLIRAAVLVLALYAAPALAQNVVFTYQGRLSDAGQPANGSYDMTARIWNAASGGNPVGNLGTYNGVQVSDGLFSFNVVETIQTLDTTDPLYLEVTVGGTPLPRQFLALAPRAGYAIKAESATTAAFAEQTQGLFYNDVQAFLGVGRQDQVTANEVFGLYRPGIGFGGMYIETDAGGQPFYGYSVNGNINAFHYFNDTDSEWKLQVGASNALAVSTQGHVGIGDVWSGSALRVNRPSSVSVYIQNDGTVGQGIGLWSATEDPNGYGVWADGGSRALYAKGSSSDAYAVFATIGKNYFSHDVGIGTSLPSNPLHVRDAANTTATPSNHIAQIENYSTGTSTDVLALRSNTADTTPSGAVNYITFFRNTSSLGAIQGNNAGGVEFAGPGNDYAEWLQQASESEAIGPGDVVAVRAGRIALDTTGADQVMVVSTAPIVTGNRPFEDEKGGIVGWQKVAFIGQAPVRVLGPVTAGDLLIPSGLHDGTAIAIHPASIAPDQLTQVLGVAWETSDDAREKPVTAAVGIDQADAASHALRAQSRRVDELEARLERLERTLSERD